MENPEVFDAIARLNETVSDQNRVALYRSLKGGWLNLIGHDIPKEWGTRARSLQEAKQVRLLTSPAPGGGQAVLAFTSISEACRRGDAAGIFAMESMAVLQLVAEQNFAGLILNAVGPWAGIPRHDVERILAGAW
jgi:hypothetical protein